MPQANLCGIWRDYDSKSRKEELVAALHMLTCFDINTDLMHMEKTMKTKKKTLRRLRIRRNISPDTMHLHSVLRSSKADMKFYSKSENSDYIRQTP